MLDGDQGREPAAAGGEIGGRRPSQMDQLDDDRLHDETARCRDIVADELGTAPASFAYPYGYSNRRVRRAVRAAGSAQSLAVGNALALPRQGSYAIQRVTVRRSTGIEEFEQLVEGRSIARNLAKHRALTKGYAVVRRTRRAVGLIRGTPG